MSLALDSKTLVANPIITKSDMTTLIDNYWHHGTLQPHMIEKPKFLQAVKVLHGSGLIDKERRFIGTPEKAIETIGRITKKI